MVGFLSLLFAASYSAFNYQREQHFSAVVERGGKQIPKYSYPFFLARFVSVKGWPLRHTRMDGREREREREGARERDER